MDEEDVDEEEDNFSLEEWSDEDDLLADLEVEVIFNLALYLTYYVVKEVNPLSYDSFNNFLFVHLGSHVPEAHHYGPTNPYPDDGGRLV